MDGFINYLKPPGMTSSDAVLSVRRLLPRGTRVGHGGTLDPDAAGVLPICVGNATRLFDILIDKEKTYLAELTLGVATDTQDATGHALAVKPTDGIGEATVRAVLPHFIGEIEQIPPAYSAVKKDGHRLYELARKGENVEVSPRKAAIFALDYLGALDYNRHMLRIVCGRGVYIRTLLHDIGDRLGCGGHMSFLLRERCGAFAIADAVTPSALPNADAVAAHLLPLDLPLGRLPRLDLPEAERARVRNGNPVSNVQGYADGATVRVYVAGDFAGIGEVDGANVRFRAMLLPR